MMDHLSIVIPIYNEQETLPELRRRVTDVIDRMTGPVEVLFVNDGSRDGSITLLRSFASEDPRLKVIDLSRNFGHQAAFYAGLCRASGDAVVLMDGDLQDPPEIIPDLVEEWRRGYDVVYAVRSNRKENVIKRVAYRTYYRLLEKIAYIPIPVDSGDFSLMSRRVVDLLGSMPERNKFLRGLRSWVGFRQTGYVYERSARYAGEPKYTLLKLLRLALDGLISYSFIPLRVLYLAGMLISLASFGLGMLYFLQKLLTDRYIPQGFTTLAILVLFIGGVQLLAVGLVGEYVGRIYDEVKRRPEYVVSELIGFDSATGEPAAEVAAAGHDSPG